MYYNIPFFYSLYLYYKFYYQNSCDNHKNGYKIILKNDTKLWFDKIALHFDYCKKSHN